MGCSSQRLVDRRRSSPLECKVPSGEWRYRLTVRTDGSQPSNRGSIPRTATMNHISPLVPSPGRWPGLLFFALLLTPLVAHAAAPLQFQSPDGRRMVHAEEARAPIV